MMEGEIIMTYEKYKYINSLKGLGMIAVVLGHSGSKLAPYVYLYHMALFFFISGYFYKNQYDEHPFLVIKKRIKKLYIPFVAYELVFMLLRNVFINLQLYSSEAMLKIENLNDILFNLKKILTFNSTEPLLATIWFISSLFYVNAVYVTIRYIIRKIKIRNEYIVFFIIVIVYLLGFYMFENNIDFKIFINPNRKKVIDLFLRVFDYRNFIILLIFHLGHLYNKYENKINMDKYLAMTFSIILLYNAYKVGSIDIALNKYTNPIYFIINALLGIYINIYLAKINILSNNRVLQYIGKKSLIVMIFHLLVFKLVNYIQIVIYKQPYEKLSSFPFFINTNGWWLVYTLVGIFVPLMIIYVYDYLKKQIFK